MNGEKTSYRLYALSLNRKNMELAASERFSRVTPYYILVYTTAEKPTGAIEIIGEELERLSAEDSRWIFDCNIAILAEEAELRKPEVMRSLSERVERLEEELAKKRQELEEGK